MPSNSSSHPEEYVKIMANVTNIANVWGKASGQYREADAMASEYLRNFMGSGFRGGEVATGGSSQKGGISAMNLAFRPKKR